MTTNDQVTTTDKAIGQLSGLVCQLEGCGKALLGKQKKYCSLKHARKDQLDTIQHTLNGLYCQLPGCRKGLVGEQKRYCSEKHCKRAHRALSASQPNGYVCKWPRCGKRLMGTQKKYCSHAHQAMASGKRLSDLAKTARGTRLRRAAGLRAIALAPHTSIAHREHYKGISLPTNDESGRQYVIEHAQEIRQRQNMLAGLTKRLNNGGLLVCPRCDSRQTMHTGARRAGRARCTTCGRYWTIGHDYGPPLTPAMVNLLRTARQTTLTPEEDAQIAELLESAYEEVTP
jgi:transposase-like protein